MTLYLSVECVRYPNNVQSVRITSVFLRRCGNYSNDVYGVLIREEIPLVLLTTDFLNVRIVERFEDDYAVLTFDGLPGQQINNNY